MMMVNYMFIVVWL